MKVSHFQPVMMNLKSNKIMIHNNNLVETKEQLRQIRAKTIHNNNSVETKEQLRQIRAKKIEEKRANIEARRQKVTSFSTVAPFYESALNFTVDQHLNCNEKEQRTRINTSGSDLSMTGMKLEFVDDNSDVFNEINLDYIEPDVEINTKILKKKKSNSWIEHKRSLFDKASLVYLQSRNAKEFIEKRKSEELEKKRIKVNNIRNFHIASITKRQQKANSLNKNLEDLIEKKDNLIDDLYLDETKSLERESSETEEDVESVTEHEGKETPSETEESHEDEENVEDNLSNDFTDSDEYESVTDSESDCDKELNRQNICANKNYTLEKELQETNFINNKDENDINKLKKEINDAYIIIKACENLKNTLNKDIPIDILKKIDQVKMQRINRRTCIENLRRARFEQAEQIRVDSRLAKSVLRAERELKVDDTRRCLKDRKKNLIQSEPKINHKKSSRWIKERQLIEQNITTRLEEEIKYLQKQMSK